MNYLKEHLRNMLTIETLFQYYNIGLPTKNNQNIRCPFPGVEDKTPSFNVKLDPPFLYKAFNNVENSKGSSGGDCFDFIAMMEQLDSRNDFKEIINKACDITNTNQKDFKEKVKPAVPEKPIQKINTNEDKKNRQKIDYIWKKGLKAKAEAIPNIRIYEQEKSVDPIKAECLYGAFIGKGNKRYFGLPIRDVDGKIVGIQKSDKFLISGSKTGFYFEDGLDFTKTVHFVEGLSDYLTTRQSGIKNCVGIHSVTVKPDRIDEFMRKFKGEIKICFDRDSTKNFLGMRLAWKLYKMNESRRKLYLACPESDDDINDVYRKKTKVSDIFNAKFSPKFFREFLFPGEKMVNYQHAGRRVCEIFNLGLIEQQDWQCPPETGIWEQIPDKEIVTGLVLDYINDHLGLDDHNPNLIDKIMKYARVYAAKRGKGIQSAFMRDQRYFSKMKDKLFLKDGMLDIRTNEITPYKPEDYVLSTLDIAPGQYNPTCPRFDQFLNEILAGDPDIDSLRQYLWEWIGYILYPHIPFHKVLFLLGDGGNGKSILLSVIQNLVGRDQFLNMEISDFHRNQFATSSLLGKQVNICTDAEKGTRLNSSIFKKASSGDAITGEFKYKGTFQFRPHAKFIFGSNNYPVGVENARWLYRRLDMVKLINEFSVRKGNIDPFLLEKLTAERCGIFWKAKDALVKLLDRGGFDTPKSVKLGTEKFIRESDKILKFIRRKIWNQKADRSGFSATGIRYEWNFEELYAEYIKFCEEHRDRYPVNETNFREAVEGIHNESKKGTVERLGEDYYVLRLSKESPFKEISDDFNF